MSRQTVKQKKDLGFPIFIPVSFARTERTKSFFAYFPVPMPNVRRKQIDECLDWSLHCTSQTYECRIWTVCTCISS